MTSITRTVKSMVHIYETYKRKYPANGDQSPTQVGLAAHIHVHARVMRTR